jgi:hypothetical protein
MKKYYLVFCFLIFLFKSNGQNSNTRYNTCSQLRVLEGEWEYFYGSDTIKVFLRYNRSYSILFNTVQDRLWGWHEYQQGNNIIQSSYQNRLMQLTYDYDDFDITKTSIVLSFNSDELDLPVFERNLTGFISDTEYDNKMHTVRAKLNNRFGNTRMIWKQRFGEFYGPIPGAKPCTMTLPRDFVLIKK